MTGRLLLVGCLTLLTATGCTKGWQRAQTAASHKMSCPRDQVYVQETREGYVAEGCGKHVECGSDGRMCREYLTPQEQMVAARRTFARETGCSETEIVVTRSTDGTVADGCGRYAMCPDSGQTCLARNRPSCQELVQTRYDDCVASARQEGKDGRRQPAWGSEKVALSSAIISGMAEHKSMDSCRQIFMNETALCQKQPESPVVKGSEQKAPEKARR